MKVMDAQDLPTSHEIVVGSLLAPSRSAFCLQHSHASKEMMLGLKNELGDGWEIPGVVCFVFSSFQ